MDTFFNEMEEKLEKLIGMVDTLKSDNRELKEKLLDSERERDSLRRNVEELSSEKNEIKRRVENLLGKLEVIES